MKRGNRTHHATWKTDRVGPTSHINQSDADGYMAGAIFLRQCSFEARPLEQHRDGEMTSLNMLVDLRTYTTFSRSKSK